MADHSAPTVSTAYATYTTNLKDRIDDVCKGLDTGGTYVALPTNSIGWNSTNNKWQKWSGTVWSDLVATTASYTININGTIGQNGATALGGSFSDLSATGAVTGAGFTARFATPGPIGSGTASTGAFSTLTTSGIAGLAASSTVGTGTAGSNNIATLGGGEILTNKTLTTPIMSIIYSGSSATQLTLPVATDTLVGRNTGDTLTNKNLTTPKIGTALWDTAGAVFLAITPVASSVNYLTLTNAVSGGTVIIGGTGTNCGISLTPTGTGTAKVGSDVIATLTAGQTVTTKTMTGGSLNSCPIGASSASTGAFTTLDASSTVSGLGFSTYLSNPPAIGGGGIPAAGTFTALVANTSLSGTGVNNLLASPTGSIGTNAPVIGRFTAAYTVPVVTTFSATAMVVNCSLSNVFTIAMTANVTTAMTFSNLKDGQTINIFITQDAIGTRTMTWPNNTVFKWPGATQGILSTAVNSVDLLVATYRAAPGFWYVSLTKNFS